MPRVFERGGAKAQMTRGPNITKINLSDLSLFIQATKDFGL